MPSIRSETSFGSNQRREKLRILAKVMRSGIALLASRLLKAARAKNRAKQGHNHNLSGKIGAPR